MTKNENNHYPVLQKIMNHQFNHEHHAMPICQMVINKKELTELLNDSFVSSLLSKDKKQELLNMEHGFIGKVCNVPLYLSENNDDNQ
ncbi:hypothetical protein OQJ16_07575 [Legionella pneumophila]|uniref:hypothetical protein n=1 Tax=Legionella pneumophila TaxID=446 RepID=UPI0022430E09|nr:hypothetical protein [Legionella pneumophila]MCW8457422.1 hypothetical protein [Legionella pneumophila]